MESRIYMNSVNRNRVYPNQGTYIVFSSLHYSTAGDRSAISEVYQTVKFRRQREWNNFDVEGIPLMADYYGKHLTALEIWRG